MLRRVRTLKSGKVWESFYYNGRDAEGRRVDTNWWHNYAAKATEVRFPKGRVKFAGATASAPFPVAVVVFRPKL